MGKVRIGIVGCGGIAREHVAAYAATGEAEVVAVTDVSAAAAAALAKDTGARAADSVAELIAKDRPDAVSVCTPPGVHGETCRPFLEAGVAVLCEKPLAATLADAAALRDAAARARAPFMVAFCHRFHPAIVELKRLIDAGTLGAPVLFRNIFAGWLDIHGNHRTNARLSGGGVVVDNASHAADLFRFLAGEPTHVHALTANVLQAEPVEDFGLLHLKAGPKVFGEITLSWSLKVSGNWVEWYGTKGTALVSYWNDGAPDLAVRTEADDAWKPVDVSGHPERFEGEIRRFLACVRGTAKPSTGAEDGYAVARVIDAAYRSAADGRLVALT